MTMSYRVLIGHPLNDTDVNRIDSIIKSTFLEVDAIYNIWNPNSELSLLNSGPGKKWIPISPELEHFLLFTDEMVELTGGYFDPTISTAYRLWTDNLKLGKLPTEEEMSHLKEVVGWQKVIVKNGNFWKEHDDLTLDLGGIAKGYCVDLITERLVEKGYTHCYVEWGGEIRTNGSHPENRPWKVYISNLTDTSPQSALAVVSLEGESLATSGDYLQQWHYESAEGASETYTHVIDPISLIPIRVTRNNICSATVKSDSCAVADALATASLIFKTVKEAKIWESNLQSKKKAKFWFVTREDLIND